MRRSSFFVRFICIGVLFHIYVGFRVIPDLPINSTGRWLAVLWLVLSCLLIPLGMVARTIKRQPLADRLAWIGLLGLGFFSSLLVLTFVRDLAMASLLTIDAIWPHAIPLTPWRMGGGRPRAGRAARSRPPPRREPPGPWPPLRRCRCLRCCPRRSAFSTRG